MIVVYIGIVIGSFDMMKIDSEETRIDNPPTLQYDMLLLRDDIMPVQST